VADYGLLRGDFSRFEQLLAAPERETLHRVRDWLAAEVVPIANRQRDRARPRHRPVRRRRRGALLYEGTRETNTLIVGRAVTGHSAFV